MSRILFLWDARPGSNIDHIRAHGMTIALWEAVFRNPHVRLPDKDDPTIFAAEGRTGGRLYRIIYGVDGETISPVTIIPVTGFPLTRRGLRENS